MTQSSSVISAEELVELIRAVAPEIIGDADSGATFDQMEFDSLSIAEIAVIVSDKFGIAVPEREVVHAGSFLELANILNDRRRLQEAP